MEMLKEKLDFDSQVIKQLLKLIPAENLRAYWSIYNSISELEMELIGLPDINFDDEVTKIIHKIGLLERSGFFMKGTLQNAGKVLLEGRCQNIGCGDKMAIKLRRQERKKKGPKHHPTNDFLVYALVSDCFQQETLNAFDWYKHGVEPNTDTDSVFNIVADFLTWQAVRPGKGNEWTSDMVRLQYGRIDPALVLETVTLFNSVKPLDIHVPVHPKGFLSAIANELGLTEIAQLAKVGYKHHKPISFKKIRKDIKKHLS